MAGSIPVDLYRVFLEAAGQQSAELGEVRYALEEVIAELGLTAQTTHAAQTMSRGSLNTQSSGGSDSTLVKVLKSGFGVAPLVGGLIGLFGGDGEEEPAPFAKYAMPASVNIEAAERGGRIGVSDYDQMGTARMLPLQAASAPQITVNVQAMDARSFLDRSGDIALAVRDAMLNSNSINDVVNDL